MSKFSVNEQDILKAQQLLMHVSIKLDNLCANLKTAGNMLVSQQGFGIYDDKQNISYQIMQIKKEIHNVDMLKDFLHVLVNRVQQADTDAKNEIVSGELDQKLRGVDNNSSAGGIFQGIQNTKENVETKYKIPEYAKEIPYGNLEFLRHKDGSLGQIYTWNIEGVQLSCTYYTLRKLRDRNLGYPCTGGPGGGGSWISNFDTESGLPYAMGDNALYDLINNEELPLENIVVSMDNVKYPAMGHVMLIDKMYRSEDGQIRVVYSDNYPNIKTIDGLNKEEDVPLESFYNTYHTNGWQTQIYGAAVIGTN